ncbi:NAD(P)-binding domain-containing protein [Rhodococcus sp. NPDC058521]|uniref:NAD(P)-binding domain-containing protein n=1 Tax=Rhodococcus sp. NPDC058521 TaxID=3346536 RepID=UPI00365D46FE
MTIVGLGAMERVLATRLPSDGHRVTVWNRTPSRARPMAEAGATIVDSVEAAVTASNLVVVCLLDADPVHEQLDPVVDSLAGRTVVNVTTTTPNEARDLSVWAQRHRINFVDGGIFATPDMIGTPSSTVLHSGDELTLDRYRTVLEGFGRTTFVGADPGAAALYDSAMPGAMYAMFAGFEQGARMVRTVGGSAEWLAEMATPFLQATATALAEQARQIDSPDEFEPVQTVEFTRDAIDLLNRSAIDASQSPDLMNATSSLLGQELVR